MTIERVTQPTDNTCWAACVSMLTGIDVDLFPLDGEVVPSANRMGMLINDNDFITWVEMLDSLGYEMRTHDDFPDKPCLIPLLIYTPDGDRDGHIVVADADGFIIDPAGEDTPISEMRFDEIDDTFCNVEVVRKDGFITIEPK